ncbi:hypothetical protein ACFXTO_040521 [Malus domestica]
MFKPKKQGEMDVESKDGLPQKMYGFKQGFSDVQADTGAQGVSTGGGIPTPNWDALADIDAVGGVTRAGVVPIIVNQLTTEASNANAEFHARRLQALKALTYASSTNSEIVSKLYEIVFGILDKV